MLPGISTTRAVAWGDRRVPIDYAETQRQHVRATRKMNLMIEESENGVSVRKGKMKGEFSAMHRSKRMQATMRQHEMESVIVAPFSRRAMRRTMTRNNDGNGHSNAPTDGASDAIRRASASEKLHGKEGNDARESTRNMRWTWRSKKDTHDML